MAIILLQRLIKRKSEVLKYSENSKVWGKNKVVKTIKVDGGGEYVSSEFDTFYAQEGILHDVVLSYTPQQNGTA